jgi:hypothetical protein
MASNDTIAFYCTELYDFNMNIMTELERVKSSLQINKIPTIADSLDDMLKLATMFTLYPNVNHTSPYTTHPSNFHV